MILFLARFRIEASGGDSVLLAEVRESLAAHEAMPTVFLARSAADHLVEDERAWFSRNCRSAIRLAGRFGNDRPRQHLSLSLARSSLASTS